MTIYALYSLINFVLAVSLGMVVFYHNPRSSLNRMFFFLCLSLGAWAFIEFGYRLTDTYETALFWNRIDVFWVLAIPFTLHMALLYIDRADLLKRPLILGLIYVPAVVMGIIDLTTDLISGPPAREFWGWTFAPASSSLMTSIVLIWCMLSGFTVISLFIRYASTLRDPLRRRGTYYVIAAMVFMTIAGNLSATVYWWGLVMPQLTVQIFLIGYALIGVAIWKYRIFVMPPGSVAETVVETMADALFIISPDKRIVHANASASCLTGYSAQELKGKPMRDFLDSPNERSEKNRSFLTIDSDLKDAEAIVHCQDGSVCPVSVSTARMPGKHPGSNGLICILRDMTDRRNAERELRKYHETLEELVIERTNELMQTNRLLIREVEERAMTEDELSQSRQRFQELVELLPEMVYEMDTNGIITYSNQQSFTMTGYTIEDYEAGFSALTLIAPEDKDRAQRNIRKIMHGAAIGASEYIAVRKDGSRFSVITKSAPVLKNGEITGLRGVFIDITDRKIKEQEILNYERRFREVLENINLIALMTDNDGTILFCNEYLAKLTGWDRNKMLGNTLAETIGPPDKRNIIRDHFTRNDIPVHFDMEIMTKSGERRLIAWNNTVLTDVDGNRIGISSIGEDITDKRNLERRFLQAQKMETVGRLAGGVAHDFNNILTIILGNADLALLMLSPEERSREYIDEIKRSTKRAADLTRQLLTFSRRQVSKPLILNLNRVIFDMDKMLRRLIGEHIELVFLPEDKLFPVKIDPGQLEQVITNLAVNARDAMPAGGTLTITTGNILLNDHHTSRDFDLPPGQYVHLSIRDTGTGMDETIMEHLFEPFFTTKAPGKGTGLGLATSYGIIRQNGGSIEMESTPGSGTCVRIYFPRTTGVYEQPSAHGEEIENVTGEETILLVEDEHSLNRMVVSMLCERGFTLHSAANGEEGLRIARDIGIDTIDIVVTDVVMPCMGGREMVSRLREIAQDIPVLYMSGYTDTHLAGEDLTMPNCGFIQKPFTPASLALKIRAILDRKPASPAV
jgi:two-component system, cell cycle sensor histidine kinase and response regulator CckA